MTIFGRSTNGYLFNWYILTLGELYAWGMGTNGQLGQGNEDDLDTPTRVL